MNRIAINQATLMNISTDNFIELASKAGFSFIELREDKLRNSLKVMSMDYLKKLVDALNVSIIALNGIEFFGLYPEENVWILERDVDTVGKLCKYLEIPLVISPVANTTELKSSHQDNDDKEEYHDTVLQRVREIAGILGTYGVKLALEPVGFDNFLYKNIHDIETLITDSGSGNLELAPDIHNIFNGGDTVYDLLNTKLQYSVIHLNDTKIGMANRNIDVLKDREFPGDGRADVRNWVNMLNKNQYSGYFSLELFDERIWKMDPENAAHYCWNKLNSFFKSCGNS